nr:hypothetical protein Itr_chr08CG09020 [Ipomoea trifida]
MAGEVIERHAQELEAGKGRKIVGEIIVQHRTAIGELQTLVQNLLGLQWRRRAYSGRLISTRVELDQSHAGT